MEWSHTQVYWLTSAQLRTTYCMSQQLGNEVERQGKAKKSTTPKTALSFQRKEEELPRVGFGTHNTLQSRRALYQLSHQGNSAGRGFESRDTTQHKANLKPLYYGTVNSHSVCRQTGVIKPPKTPNSKPSICMSQQLGNEVERQGKPIQCL